MRGDFIDVVHDINCQLSKSRNVSKDKATTQLNHKTTSQVGDDHGSANNLFF